jgi:hypothetical protein
MPRKLQIIAKEQGEPLDTLIPRLIEEYGTVYKVAVHLGVYPNTIRNWLMRSGYQQRKRPASVWVKEPESRNA